MKELSSRPRPMPIALPIYPVALRQGVSAEHVDSHSLLDIRDLNSKKTLFWGLKGSFIIGPPKVLCLRSGKDILLIFNEFGSNLLHF